MYDKAPLAVRVAELLAQTLPDPETEMVGPHITVATDEEVLTDEVPLYAVQTNVYEPQQGYEMDAIEPFGTVVVTVIPQAVDVLADQE